MVMLLFFEGDEGGVRIWSAEGTADDSNNWIGVVALAVHWLVGEVHPDDLNKWWLSKVESQYCQTSIIMLKMALCELVGWVIG